MSHPPQTPRHLVGHDALAVIDGDGIVTLSGCARRVPWWSFTKTVLSIAALRLVENGLVALDGTLPGEPFSLRQLLRHEAGLADYGSLAQYHADVAAGQTPWPVDRLLKRLDAGRLRYAPGAGWAYSNIGYLKVARLIEDRAALELGAALAALVFRPAGLQTARLAVQPSDLADVAMGGVEFYHPGWVYHGLVVGTLADAARLLWLLVTRRLLQPGTLADMKTRHALPEHRSALHPDPAYGLGLMLSAKDPDEYPMGHSGEGPGSRIAVYAQGNRVAAVWTTLPADITAEAKALALLRHPA